MKPHPVASLLFVAFVFMRPGVYAQSVDPSFPAANATIFASVSSGNTVYVGGGFTYIGPSTGYGSAISKTSGSPDLSYSKIDGPVYAVVSDGSGGWYIGGSFTKVGGVLRNNLARLTSSGVLDATWNPNANNTVRTLALSGSVVYVGGEFTQVAGETRNRLAAVDASTGILSPWDPDASGTVFTIRVNGVIYVGGSFMSISQQPRRRIAALYPSTGEPTDWSPSVGGQNWWEYVNDIVVFGGKVYVCGVFTHINAQYRPYLAAISAKSGQLLPWSPNPDNWVRAMVVSNSTLYVGGDFTSIASQSRQGLAAFNTSTYNLENWSPAASEGVVTSLAASDTVIYIGGRFASIAGQSRLNIASVGRTGGAPMSWNPGTDEVVWTIAASSSVVYAGGWFTMVGGQRRNRLAAFDAKTGEVASWNPNVDDDTVGLDFEISLGDRLFVSANEEGSYDGHLYPQLTFGISDLTTPTEPVVFSLAISGSTIYAGGWFAKVGGTTRHYLAAIDAATGNVTNWNPNPNQAVYALAQAGSTVYVGGEFTTIGTPSQARSHIAAIDGQGHATNWNPGANLSVLSLAVGDNEIYSGGMFTAMGGLVRERLAKIKTDGEMTDWAPNADNWVYSIALSGSTVYVGGEFSSIGGLGRSCIAEVYAGSGGVTGWYPTISGGGDPATMVRAISPSASTIYVGGQFYFVGSLERHSIASIDRVSGIATDWDPALRLLDFYTAVYSLTSTCSVVHMGGFFYEAGHTPQRHLAAVTPDGMVQLSGTVSDGWNMTSIPNVLCDFSKVGVYPNACSDAFRYTLDGYVATDPLSNGPGWWIEFPSQQPIYYVGSEIDHLNIPVNNLWNLIGSISSPVDTHDVVLNSPVTRLTDYFKYDGGYEQVATLMPGGGYWVKYSAQGTITLQGGSQRPGSSYSNPLVENLDKFIITDSRGRRQELYVRKARVGIDPEDESMEMPPDPPNGAFSVRFSSGNFVQAVSQSQGRVAVPIAIRTARFPLTFAWDLSESSGMTYWRSGEILPLRGSVIIQNLSNGILHLEAEAGEGNSNGPRKASEIPLSYAIHNNHPNPFNPSTQIRFELPEAAKVSLVVYDMLGRKVAELANGNYEAGYHTAVWNASDLASGVYLARFNVVNQLGNSVYTKTNKLVLMK